MEWNTPMFKVSPTWLYWFSSGPCSGSCSGPRQFDSKVHLHYKLNIAATSLWSSNAPPGKL